MSKKTMKKNNSIRLHFTIAIWWFSVRTVPVMGGCKNDTKNHEKTRKIGGFPFLEQKKKTGNGWFFRFLKKRKNHPFPVFLAFLQVHSCTFEVHVV